MSRCSCARSRSVLEQPVSLGNVPDREVAMIRICSCMAFGAVAGVLLFAALAFIASEYVDANLISV